MNITETAIAAKAASIRLAAVNSEDKNKALTAIARALSERAGEIVSANKEDLANAEREKLAGPLLKRLKFDEAKIAEVCAGLESLIKLAEPVGKTISATELDEGLELYKVSCPVGVVGVIFESRPDALVQIAGLCLKSANAVLLKGGSEAEKTNRILAEIISNASVKATMPAGWLGLLETRDQVAEMLGLDEYIDLIVPRGSNEFVRYIMDNTNIAVLGHADGICHVYVDENADLKMAEEISFNAKAQRPGVCNAMETLLVHENVADSFVLPMATRFVEAGVELRGCPKTCQLFPGAKAATEDDWGAEYLDLILAVKVVSSMEEAIDHIASYGSAHTEAIVTSDYVRARQFLKQVDASVVLVNASTRFNDGGELGLGAEIGISTSKLHAYGPMGLEELTTTKFVVFGDGQVRT